MGKSCFLVRFADDSFFGDSYVSTIGVDFKLRTVNFGGRTVKLQLWDTSGQERFRTITSSYYRGAHGIFIAYDITDERSFSNVRVWLNEIERYACENVSKLVLGLKADLSDHRQVSYASAKDFADSMGVPLFECSSKENRNVSEAVLALVQQIGRRLDADLDPAHADLSGSAAAAPRPAADDDEASAESISDDELATDLGTLATKPKSKPASGAAAAAPSGGKRRHKAAKTNVNIFRLGLDTLAREVEVVTGDPCFCQRCGVMLSSLSKIESLTRAEADKRTAAAPVGPTFTPAPPIHQRFEKQSWVGSAQEGKGKAPEAAAAPSADGAAPAGDAEEKHQYWTCEFCGFANRVDLDEGEIPHEQTVDYVVKPPAAVPDAAAAAASSASAPPNIVFAIDVSGSMCVTLEVDGRHDFKGTAERNARDRAAAGAAGWAPSADRRTGKAVTHVSRLQCLQIAIEAQIKKIARETPEKRVGIITFSDEVTLIGDGTQEPVVISGEKLNSWERLGEIGAGFKLEKCARDAEAGLLKRLWELEESGATALGPALRLGVAIAGAAPGSSVVLATDGLANLFVFYFTPFPADRLQSNFTGALGVWKERRATLWRSTPSWQNRPS